MSATQAAGQVPRPQYGNFRPTRRAGLFGVPLLALGGLIASAGIGFAMLLTQHWLLALVWTLLVVASLVPMLVRDSHDRTAYQALSARLMFTASRRAGGTVYLSGPAGTVPDGKFRAPGLLAASHLSEHKDAYGGSFGLLHVPATQHFSVVLEATPADYRLLDDDVIDTLVARWGGFLADLGSYPSIDGASVTVETAPDPGITLRSHIASQLRPDAPDFAAATLAEIAETFPAVAAQVTTRITLTWSAFPPVNQGSLSLRRGKPRPRSRAEMAVEIGNMLPSVLAGLKQTGAGAGVRALSAQDIVDITKVAYSPSVANVVEQARADGGTGLSWDDVGPTGAVAGWDVYRHDYAWSRTWYMTTPHRGAFPAEALSRLLAPHRDIARKRVTVLYRPEPLVQAAEIVDRAYLDAMSEANQGRATARDLRAVRVAARTAEEEASGASLLRFGVIVTATVLEREQLDMAATTVEGLAAAPRLRMRVAQGNQAAAFAAGLPLGLVLPKHLIIGADLRDQLM